MRGRGFNALGGLSGHASSMISSLKNNLRRKEIGHFQSVHKSSKYKKGEIVKKATPHQLKEIREKLQKENKKEFIITTTVIIVLIIIFLFLFKY